MKLKTLISTIVAIPLMYGSVITTEKVEKPSFDLKNIISLEECVRYGKEANKHLQQSIEGVGLDEFDRDLELNEALLGYQNLNLCNFVGYDVRNDMLDAAEIFLNENQYEDFGDFHKKSRLFSKSLDEKLSKEIALIGKLARKLGKAKDAIKFGREAVNIDSENPYALEQLAFTLYQTSFNDEKEVANQKLNEAISLYEKVIYLTEGKKDFENRTEKYDSLVVLGKIHQEKGDLEKAHDLMIEAADFNPNRHDALSALSKLEDSKGNKTGAISYVNQALNINPDNSYLLGLKSSYEKSVPLSKK